MTDNRKLNVEKGKQGFQETSKRAAAETDLADTAYKFATEHTDAYGNNWTYLDGPSDLGEYRRGWQSTHDNGAVMEVSNDGTSMVGIEWYVRNTDGLSMSGETDYEDEALRLAAEQAAWGVCGIRYAQRSPWGKVDDIRRVAPGITFVGTSSHGGLKLSPERNKAMPSAFRNRSGWYEKDTELDKVRLRFPAEFVAKEDHFRGVPYSEAVSEIRKNAAKHVLDLFPDEFSAAGFGHEDTK